MITDAELTGRIDPALAVDRALNAAERGAYLEYRLIGGYDGASIADWIAEAQNADAYVQIADRWWSQAGDAAVDYLMALHELPEELLRALLAAALYATCGITSATLGQEPWTLNGRRTHIEIASGAALYARGYAEALGWQPHQLT